MCSSDLLLVEKAIDESGESDNTIIIFTSEHGEMGGDHGMLEKRSLYEEVEYCEGYEYKVGKMLETTDEKWLT